MKRRPPTGHIRPRGLRAAALLATLAVLAASCGDDDDDDGSEGGDPPSTDATATTEDPTGADPDSTDTEDPDDTEDTHTGGTTPPQATDGGGTAGDEPTQGGELIVATLFDSFGFDPTNIVGSVADGTVAGAVFETLMVYDENNEVVPLLAEALETDDYQTWTLRLRPDVNFTDGTPLDAEAIKYNIERHQDVDNLSRAILNAWNVETMTVVDPVTLELELAFPWTAFPGVLTGPLGIVGSPTALEDPETFNTQPVGAGPFELVEWVPGDHITLERNPDYWNADAGQPYLDRITLRLVLDTQTRVASVQRGEVHLAQSTNGAEVMFADEDGLVGFPVHGPGITIQMNMTQPPFDDLRVRMAALQAIDRETLFDVVFEGAGSYPPNDFLIANDSEFAATDLDYPEFDPEAAAQLVAEYEAENGPISFTYFCHTQPDLVNMAQVVQQMWTAVGMDVDVEIKDQQALVMDIFQKNYEISCFGSVGQEDPDLAFYGILHSESPTNSVGYVNPDVDEALDAGRQSADPDERRDAYRVVQEAIATDVPMFQAVTSPWGWFGNDEVGGMFTRRNAIFNTAEVYLR